MLSTLVTGLLVVIVGTHSAIDASTAARPETDQTQQLNRIENAVDSLITRASTVERLMLWNGGSQLDRIEDKVNILGGQLSRIEDVVVKGQGPTPGTIGTGQGIDFSGSGITLKPDRVVTEGNPGTVDISQCSRPLETIQVPDVEGRGADTALVFLEARREAVGDQLRFSVRYWTADRSDLKIFWWFGERFEQGLQHCLVSTTGDIWEDSVLVESGDTSGMPLIFFVSADTQEFLLHLDNSNNSDVVQSTIYTPMLTVNPKGDFVYQEGNDFLAQVHTDRFEDLEGDPTFGITSLLVNLDTGGVEMEDSDETFANFSTRKTSEDIKTAEVRFNTSMKHVSGIISFRGGERYDGVLVQAVEVNRVRYLRPMGQAGPFPSGYVGFPTRSWAQLESDGTEVEICRLELKDSQCSTYCHVVGDDLEGLKALQVLPDDHMEAVTLESPNNLTYHSSIIVMHGMLKATSGNNSSSRTETYECMAWNKAGNVATKTIRMVYILDLRLETNQSRITQFNETALNVTCVARGDPLPNMTLEITYGWSREVTLIPDQSFQTDQHMLVTSTLVPYRDETSGFNYSGYTNEVSMVKCDAYQVIRDSSKPQNDYYYMYPEDYSDL